MKKRLCIAVGFIFISNFAAGYVQAIELEEIIKHYEQSLKPINSRVAFDLESNTVFAGAWDPEGERIRQVGVVYRNGDCLGFEFTNGASIDDGKTFRNFKRKFVLNEQNAMAYYIPTGDEKIGRLHISTDVDELRRASHRDIGASAVFDGHLSGCNDLTIPELLREATSLRLRGAMESIDGHDTYVLEAATKYGKHTLWIDPDAGFCPRRITVQKKIGDLQNNRPLGKAPPPLPADVSSATPWLAVVKYETKIEAIQIENISGIFIPVAAKISNYREYENGQSVECVTVCKREAIDFNPDFEAMNAFVIEVPDGTPVSCDDTPGVNYIWRKGQIINEYDGSVRQMPKKRMPLISVGKPLPKFEDIKLPAEQTQDKMILVCFFDYQQRPSRNCILQLSKRADELKAEDIIIAAIQASKIEQVKLDKWIKENNIDFPVGMINGDSEKTRFKWGVKSLPWLILTDKNHVVVAEGFSLDELDERIKTPMTQ